MITIDKQFTHISHSTTFPSGSGVNLGSFSSSDSSRVPTTITMCMINQCTIHLHNVKHNFYSSSAECWVKVIGLVAMILGWPRCESELLFNYRIHWNFCWDILQKSIIFAVLIFLIRKSSVCTLHTYLYCCKCRPACRLSIANDYGTSSALHLKVVSGHFSHNKKLKSFEEI